MNAGDDHRQTEPLASTDAIDRSTCIGGLQSKRILALNEGVVRHLYETGMTQIEIARELGTSKRSVYLFMAKCGIKGTRGRKARSARGEEQLLGRQKCEIQGCSRPGLRSAWLPSAL